MYCKNIQRESELCTACLGGGIIRGTKKALVVKFHIHSALYC